MSLLFDRRPYAFVPLLLVITAALATAGCAFTQMETAHQLEEGTTVGSGSLALPGAYLIPKASGGLKRGVGGWGDVGVHGGTSLFSVNAGGSLRRYIGDEAIVGVQADVMMPFVTPTGGSPPPSQPDIQSEIAGLDGNSNASTDTIRQPSSVGPEITGPDRFGFVSLTPRVLTTPNDYDLYAGAQLHTLTRVGEADDLILEDIRLFAIPGAVGGIDYRAASSDWGVQAELFFSPAFFVLGAEGQRSDWTTMFEEREFYLMTPAYEINLGLNYEF